MLNNPCNDLYNLGIERLDCYIYFDINIIQKLEIFLKNNGCEIQIMFHKESI